MWKHPDAVADVKAATLTWQQKPWVGDITTHMAEDYFILMMPHGGRGVHEAAWCPRAIFQEQQGQRNKRNGIEKRKMTWHEMWSMKRMG